MANPSSRSLFCKAWKIQALLIFIMCLGGSLTAVMAGLWESQKKTVVLDPGHGGQDTGVIGSDTSAEKTTSLFFARLLEDHLKDAYRVVLTRTDDYRVDLIKRTATANHEKANLFISIHSSHDPLKGKQGVDLFYLDASCFSQTADGQEPAGTKGLPSEVKRWDDLQAGHVDESLKLAQKMALAIQESLGLPVRVHSIPLFVLKGADMPALLIEIGALPEGEDGKPSKTGASLAGLAKTVGDVVSDYLK